MNRISKIGVIVVLMVAFFILLITVFGSLHHTAPLPQNTIIDYILVEKSKHMMSIYSNGMVVKTYDISLGSNPIGPKQFEGDKKTPEGIYTIESKNPKSSFHLNLGVSYPNQDDRDFAKSQGKDPGGDIKIHGLHNAFGFIGSLHRLTDWTNGCIALTNSEMDELYHATPIGTMIEIKP